jgi:hypothetical protein
MTKVKKSRVILDISAMARALETTEQTILDQLALSTRPRHCSLRDLVKQYKKSDGLEQIIQLVALSTFFVKRE